MQGESFTVNGKTYTIKNLLSFGDYRRMSASNSNMARLTKGIDDGSVDETELTIAGDEQLQNIADFLEKNLGLTQDEVDQISTPEMIEIFTKGLALSTTPNKDIKKT